MHTGDLTDKARDGLQLKDDYKIKLAGIDVDNVLRGKIMQKEKFLSVVKSSTRSFGFCRSVARVTTDPRESPRLMHFEPLI